MHLFLASLRAQHISGDTMTVNRASNRVVLPILSDYVHAASQPWVCVCVCEREKLLFCLSFKVIKLHLQICCECLFKWLRFKNILMTFLVWLCNLFNIFTSVYPIGKTYLLLSSAKTLSLSLFPPQKRKKLFLLVIV